MLVANSWNCIKTGKWKTALLILAIGVTIHTVTIAFLVAYCYYVFRKNKFVLFLLIVATFYLLYNYELIINFADEEFEKYNNYYDNEKQKQIANNVVYLWLLEALLSLWILLKKKFTREQKIVAVLGLIYVCCNVLGTEFNYFERLGICFMPFVWCVFDIFGRSIKNRTLQWAYCFLAELCFLIYFSMSWGGQYAYSFYFNDF